MPRQSLVYTVALPLDVTLEPVLESDPPQWFAVTAGSLGGNIGRFTAEQLTGAGVDVARLQRPDEHADQYAARRIFESLGAASCCWENMDGTGKFDSVRASNLGCELLADLGLPIPDGYRPPAAEYVDPTTPDIPAADPIESPPAFSAGPYDFYAPPPNATPEPDTMFAGIEPQHVEPAPETRTWLDRNGSCLAAGDAAVLLAAPRPPAPVTVEGPPPGETWPDQVVQVRHENDATELAIAHIDLVRAW
jgi:hypothetical protein